MAKVRIALFASGAGSNALKIIDHFCAHPSVEIGFLLSNKKDALVVGLSNEKGIHTITSTNEQVADGNFLTTLCRENKIDFIILAGYLRKIPVELLKNYTDRIINIHPALLPKHGGAGMYGKYVHEAVLHAKEQETGITIHYVNEHFDEGRIIAQFHCEVKPSDTVESIQAKIQRLEHTYFPYVIEKTILS